MLLAQPGQWHIVRDQYQSAAQRQIQGKHLGNDFLHRSKVVPEPSDSAKAENSGRRIPSYGRARPLAHLRPMQIGQRLDTSNVQPSHDGQQSTFPGARGAHNGCGAAGRERKINAMQNFKRSASGSNALENMVNDNHLGRGVQGNRKGWIHDW